MVKGTYKALPANATVNPEAVISMPTLWNEGSGGNYSWQGGDSYPEYIRFPSRCGQVGGERTYRRYDREVPSGRE